MKTPETDKLVEKSSAYLGGAYLTHDAIDLAKRLEVERDEWKAKACDKHVTHAGPFVLVFEPRTETYTIHRAGILWLSEGFSKPTAERVCDALNVASRLTLDAIPPLPDA